MEFLFNSDLLILGITVASTLILAVTAFFSDVRNVTNRFFLFFSISIVALNIEDYFSYHVTDPHLITWVVRFVIFIAAFHGYTFFMFAYVFPKEKLEMRPLFSWGLFIGCCIMAVLNLTPFVFSSVIFTSGQIAKSVPGPGIAVFTIYTLVLVIASFVLLIKNIIRSKTSEEKIQSKLLFAGIFIMFAFLIPFDFILPAIFENSKFVPLASTFSLPFVLFTSYAIFKHHLLNIKVVTTEILTFVLCVISLVDVISSTSLTLILFRSAVFVFVLVFGIFLIQSVIKEVSQRERSEKLANEVAVKNKELNQTTDELNKQLAEIEKMNRYMADRDAKMNELNKELSDLKTKVG